MASSIYLRTTFKGSYMAYPTLTDKQKEAIEFQFNELFADHNASKVSRILPFLESLHEQFENKKFLTDKQIAALNNIYERSTE